MNFLRLLARSAVIWVRGGAEQHAAALAYFIPFSLAPLILISITIVGIIIGREDVIALLLRWGGFIDPALPQFMQTSLANFEILTTSYTIPVLALLFFSLMILFMLNSLSSGLESLWNVEKNSFRNLLKRSGRAVLFLIVFQVYLVATIICNNIFTSATLHSGLFIFQILAPLVFFMFTTVFFAIGYGLLPLWAPSFRARLYGAAVATLLFLFTRTLVALHVATSPSPDIYGAAGLVFVLLIWMYMSACIIYYGASFALAYDQQKITK